MAGWRIHVNSDTAGANAHRCNRLGSSVTKGPRRKYFISNT